MEPEITIGIHRGNVTLSFKTDLAGSNVKESVKAIKEILSTHEDLLESLDRGQKAATKYNKLTHLAYVAEPQVTLESLHLPSEVKDKIVSNIRALSRLKLVMILLYYSKGLTYKNIMTLSKDLGKPIIYGWLNTDFQRKEHREFIRSEPIQGSQEKLYSLTEPGKKKAEKTIEEIKADR